MISTRLFVNLSSFGLDHAALYLPTQDTPDFQDRTLCVFSTKLLYSQCQMLLFAVTPSRPVTCVECMHATERAKQKFKLCSLFNLGNQIKKIISLVSLEEMGTKLRLVIYFESQHDFIPITIISPPTYTHNCCH